MPITSAMRWTTVTATTVWLGVWRARSCISLRFRKGEEKEASSRDKQETNISKKRETKKKAKEEKRKLDSGEKGERGGHHRGARRTRSLRGRRGTQLAAFVCACVNARVPPCGALYTSRAP